MKFNGLTLDIGLVDAQLKYDCKTCVVGSDAKLCAGCERLAFLYSSSLENPHSSIVMFPPRLYCLLFGATGPVAYFDVVVAYIAVFDAIKGICDPNSPYKKDDEEWTKQAYKPRCTAWMLLERMLKQLPERARTMVPSKGKKWPTRLQFIQLMEDVVIYGMAVMQVVSLDKIDYDRLDVLYDLAIKSKDARIATYGSTGVVEWKKEWVRANGDCVDEVYAQNEEWNANRERIARKNMLAGVTAKKGGR
jgi:hypothetical protein